MPQTLLATLALALAGVFMLGQSETSMHNVEAVVRDEFELAATGALLQAMEFADSRSFDEATTPAALRVRFRLPLVMTPEQLDLISGDDIIDIPASALAPAPTVGMAVAEASGVCNIATPSLTPLCNDLTDLHDSGWQRLDIAAVPGVTVPVEVRYEVSYVDAARPDVRVNRPTFHKRVEVWARSPDLARRLPDHQIRMHRVISYDPDVAAEYLRRTIRTSSTACVAEQARLDEAAAAAAVAAQTAQNAANQAATAAATARATATQRAAAAAQAATAAQQAAQAVTAAQNLLAQRQAQASSVYNAALSAFYAGNWTQATSLYNYYQTLNGQLASYQQAVTTAQANATAASAAAASAQATSAQAAQAATAAEASAAQAAASAATAHSAAQAAAAAASAQTCT